ncbi:MAG: PASTA domain-containing protein [Clostridia bacterium]|nr:PASTA domain-containing protein [Clostridia bacterium]
MKYRVKSLYFRIQKNKVGIFRAVRTPHYLLYSVSVSQLSGESIDLDALFELGELPSPKKSLRRSRQSAYFRSVAIKFANAIKGGALALFKALTLPFKRIKNKNRRLAFYSGVLTAAVIVLAISAFTAMIGLFGAYLAPYEIISVPDVTGMTLDDAEASIGQRYELLISYKNNNDIPAGTIVSQIPNAGVDRRLYKSTDKCILTLTVSAGRKFYTVGEFQGQNSRNALLELKNLGVSVKTVLEHSNSVDVGTVISTFPSSGQRLYEGEALTVKISLGKKISLSTVPDLYGLNEAAAASLLASRGLTLGTITYRHSQLEAGKIISQSYSPYTSLAEGTPINVTVSLGNKVQEKTVPELYGLSIDEARQRLAEVGLVIGSIYTVSSGAPLGTVIAQSPIVGTPITSSLTHVDVYISS